MINSRWESMSNLTPRTKSLASFARSFVAGVFFNFDDFKLPSWLFVVDCLEWKNIQNDFGWFYKHKNS